MSRQTFKVQLPDGRTDQRRSERPYAFAVIAEVERWDAPGEWRWGAVRWSATAKAAQAAASGFDSQPYMRNVQVVELQPDPVG